MRPLAIDVGTTNIKLHMFDDTELIDQLILPVDTYREDNGKVYQSPARILNQIKRGIRSLTQKGYEIDSIVLSTAMHTIMPIYDNNGDEMYIFLDTQGQSFIEEIKKEDNYIDYYKKTGTPLHYMSPFAKIGSFQKQSWFNEVKCYMGLKDYLMKHLTGEYVVDYSIASATGLFNIHTKKWDHDILKRLSITENQLPKLVDTNYSADLRPIIAQELFLSNSVRVYVGASDGCLASYASYVANSTLGTLTVGTSGAVRKISKTIELDEVGQTFCYYLNDSYWVVGAATNNGGQIIDWMDTVFSNGLSIYLELSDILNQTPIGSSGLMFFPYLSGERAPLWQAKPNGMFVGLQLDHDKSTMIRSVIEGIFYNLRYISELVNLDSRELTVNGGFFQNDSLTTMASDVFGKNVVQSDYSEPTFGAIHLIKPLKSYVLSDHRRTFYTENNHQKYDKQYHVFKETLEKNYLH